MHIVLTILGITWANRIKKRKKKKKNPGNISKDVWTNTFYEIHNNKILLLLIIIKNEIKETTVTEKTKKSNHKIMKEN